MGFLSGGLACTRFTVVSQPEKVDFEQAPFHLIQQGSSITESIGFVPFEIEEEFEIGKNKYAFRLRIDKINVDSTLVKERLRELIKSETEQGNFVGPQIKRKLKELAQDEVLSRSAARSKMIEGVIDNGQLFIGSTSKGHLGTVLEHLLKVGVEVEYKTPWLEKGMEEEISDLIDLKEPGQSIYGCRFLKALIGDPECLPEPEKGSIKLATTSHAKVTLSGEVMGELDRYIEEGAEILSAKLILNDQVLSLDGLAYRINGLKLENVRADHYTEVLDARMEMLKSVWETLDEKFDTLIGQIQNTTTV